MPWGDDRHQKSGGAAIVSGVGSTIDIKISRLN
jgi:hypothetical protein